LPTSDLEINSWGFLELINLSQQIFWATFLTSISSVPDIQSTTTFSLAGMGSNFRKNMIFDSNGVYALFFDASGVLQSRNMVQGESRAVVYSFATLYGGTIQERETPFFPAVPYNPYEQAPLPTQGSRITTPYVSPQTQITTPFVIPQTQITTPYVSSDIQIINPLYSQGGRTTPYNKTPFPTTQGPTQQPYRTLLKIRLNNGTIKPLMAMSDPLNPYLKVDEDTGNIIVYDSAGSIVFCLEMVNVKYNTFTSLTIDVEGNWVVSNKYSPGPEYSWNSGIVLPVFEYIGNNSYYYYDKNNQDRNTNVLYEFIEPTTPPTPPTTNPYKKTTIPYNTTVPQGSTPPPNSYTLYTNFDSQGSWNSILPDPYYTEISNADGKADDKCKELCDTKPLCVAASVYDAGNQTKQCRILDKIAGVDSTTEYITYVDKVNLYVENSKQLRNSGTNYTGLYHYNNSGNDLITFSLPNNDTADGICSQACQYNPSCKTFTVEFKGGGHKTCQLKSKINDSGLTYEDGYSSFVKLEQNYDFGIYDPKYGDKMGGEIIETRTVNNGAYDCGQICEMMKDNCRGFYINNDKCTLYKSFDGTSQSNTGGNSYRKKVFTYNKQNIWEKTDKINDFHVLQMTPAGWHETGIVDIQLLSEVEVYMIGGSGAGGYGGLGTGIKVGGGGGGGATGFATYGKIGPGTFTIRISRGGRADMTDGNGESTVFMQYRTNGNTYLEALGGAGGINGNNNGSAGGQESYGTNAGSAGSAGGTTGEGGEGGAGGSTTFNPLYVYSLSVLGGKGGNGSSTDSNGNRDPTSGTCGWIYIKY
jgi:hypothetical protein